MGFVNFRLEERLGRSNTGSVITELGIGNFKAFGEMQRVPVKPLTLIFGANSSGKSSILQGLLLAHHGMETGEYDAHQTKLAGDLVDLGGFRNYVHKHDVSSAVKLCFETEIDREALLDHLLGKRDERLPFLKTPHAGPLSRFGLCLTLGGPEPSLAGLEVLLNQLPVLTFSHRATGQFQAQTTAGSESYFSQMFWEHLEPILIGARREKINKKYKRKASRHPLSPEDRMARDREIERSADVFRQDIASGACGDFPAKYLETFAQAIGELEFSFEKGVLRSPDHNALNFGVRYSGGRESLAKGDGALFDAFRQAETSTSPEALHMSQVLEEAFPLKLGPPGLPGHPFNPAGLGGWALAEATRHNFSALAEFCTRRIADVLDRMSYLGPLRSVPSRYASVEGAMDASALASGGGAWDEIRRHPGVLLTVNGWLGPGRLRLPYVLKSLPSLDVDRLRLVSKGYEGSAESLIEKMAESPDSSILVFEDVNAGTRVSHRDIGFGVGQVLPVLVNAAAMRERLIAIEQPELHLHPAQQAELGDVFIESALGERKNTFLLETHSEHLILRILRRVRETTEGKLPAGTMPVRPEDVSVLFVEPTSQGSIVRQLPVTPDGDFGAPWPGGFFAERFQDLP
jgi:AAA ATPase domain/AAA domain